MFKEAFQGSTALLIFTPQGRSPMDQWKVSGTKANCSKVYRPDAKSHAIECAGGPSTKMQLPNPDSAPRPKTAGAGRRGPTTLARTKQRGFRTLHVVQRFLVVQIFLDHADDFTIHIYVRDQGGNKRRLSLSTKISKGSSTNVRAHLPLGVVVRNVWNNLVFDLHDLVSSNFAGHAFDRLDSIVVEPRVTIRRIFSHKEQPYDTSGDGEVLGTFTATDGVVEIKKEHDFGPRVEAVTQVYTMEKVVAWTAAGENGAPTSRLADSTVDAAVAAGSGGSTGDAWTTPRGRTRGGESSQSGSQRGKQRQASETSPVWSTPDEERAKSRGGGVERWLRSPDGDENPPQSYDSPESREANASVAPGSRSGSRRRPRSGRTPPSARHKPGPKMAFGSRAPGEEASLSAAREPKRRETYQSPYGQRAQRASRQGRGRQRPQTSIPRPSGASYADHDRERVPLSARGPRGRHDGVDRAESVPLDRYRQEPIRGRAVGLASQSPTDDLVGKRRGRALAPRNSGHSGRSGGQRPTQDWRRPIGVGRQDTSQDSFIFDEALLSSSGEFVDVADDEGPEYLPDFETEDGSTGTDDEAEPTFSTPPIGLGIAPPARDASNASIEEITLGSGSGKIGGGTDGRTDSREARRRRRGRSAKDTASSTNGSLGSLPTLSTASTGVSSAGMPSGALSPSMAGRTAVIGARSPGVGMATFPAEPALMATVLAGSEGSSDTEVTPHYEDDFEIEVEDVPISTADLRGERPRSRGRSNRRGFPPSAVHHDPAAEDYGHRPRPVSAASSRRSRGTKRSTSRRSRRASIDRVSLGASEGEVPIFLRRPGSSTLRRRRRDRYGGNGGDDDYSDSEGGAGMGGDSGSYESSDRGGVFSRPISAQSARPFGLGSFRSPPTEIYNSDDEGGERGGDDPSFNFDQSFGSSFEENSADLDLVRVVEEEHLVARTNSRLSVRSVSPIIWTSGGGDLGDEDPTEDPPPAALEGANHNDSLIDVTYDEEEVALFRDVFGSQAALNTSQTGTTSVISRGGGERRAGGSSGGQHMSDSIGSLAFSSGEEALFESAFRSSGSDVIIGADDRPAAPRVRPGPGGVYLQPGGQAGNNNNNNGGDRFSDRFSDLGTPTMREDPRADIFIPFLDFGRGVAAGVGTSPQSSDHRDDGVARDPLGRPIRNQSLPSAPTHAGGEDADRFAASPSPPPPHLVAPSIQPSDSPGAAEGSGVRRERPQTARAAVGGKAGADNTTVVGLPSFRSMSRLASARRAGLGATNDGDEHGTMPVLDEAEAMMRRRGRRLSGDNGRPVTPPIITPSTVSPRTAPPTDLHDDAYHRVDALDPHRDNPRLDSPGVRTPSASGSSRPASTTSEASAMGSGGDGPAPLELVYDQVLNIFYDPKTYQYYELQ